MGEGIGRSRLRDEDGGWDGSLLMLISWGCIRFFVVFGIWTYRTLCAFCMASFSLSMFSCLSRYST